ncbi:hypothetical protein HPB50_019497 [Hyalomma asiaticum]|uniref:Uncharacterized protein n=1 Tax=Hyalomma asiaticum TaxID=266040 RepID=A0ACB7S4A1_HYAAI|nr:hypothetical protein HPB50_019497 [Hyalomma asiaticum]
MLTAASLESLLLQMLDRLDSPSPASGRHRGRQRGGGGRFSLRAEIRTLDLWRAVVGECLATFFYVFLVCGAHVSWPGYAEPSVLAISLATGAAAAAVVQCYARVSGAHMNPAVTFAAFATRKVSSLRALLYVTAQCGGGIAGAALLYGVTLPGHRSSLGSSRPHEALGAWQAFGVEFVLSFLLASTVFATRDPHRCHLSTGGADALVVGFAYLTCTLAGLPASGASLNPARSLGPAFVMNKWKNHWVYWFGPVAGGLLAGLIYEYIFDTRRSSREVGRRSVEDTDKEAEEEEHGVGVTCRIWSKKTYWPQCVMAEEADARTRSTFRTLQTRSSSIVGCVAGVVVAGVAAVAVLLYFLSGSQRSASKRLFCCPQFLGRIASIGNLTLDACERFFEYACYRYLGSRGKPYTWIFNVGTDPIYGYPITEAGRAVSSYYKRCLQWVSDSSQRGTSSAQAIVDQLNLDSDSVATINIISLMLELSLRYDLPSLLEFAVLQADGANSFSVLDISLPSFQKARGSDTEEHFAKFLVDALDVIKKTLGAKVSIEEVRDYFNRLEKSRRNLVGTENTTVDSLAKITEGRVSASEWREFLGDLTRYDQISRVVSVPLVFLEKHTADLLKPENHQRSVALILVAASVHLAEKISPVGAGGNESALFCEMQASALRPLWILDKIEYYPTQLQNAAIRSAYATIVRAVVQRLQNDTEAPDVEKMNRTLNSVRLLFPSDVVPKDVGLPALSSSPYAQGYLSAREYTFRLRRHLADALNVGPEVIERLERRNVSFDEKTLTVPLAVYTMVPLENAVDTLVTMSSVGIVLAQAVWDMVLKGNWSNTIEASIKAYRSCVKYGSNRLVPLFGTSLWLAIDTCLQVARGHGLEYRLEDDYEDSSGSKNAKYATVSQSLNGGVASGSTARHARAAKAVRQQQQQQQQAQQYDAGCFGRPAANTYSPTPSLAFPSSTEAAYASTLAAANCTAQIYDLEMPSGHFRRAWSTDKDLDLQDSKLYI